MLTDKVVVAAVAREKAFKLADAGGLFLHLSTRGTRSWRYKSRVGGKERLLVIGRYPDVSVKAARLARDEAEIALVRWRDPLLERRRIKLVGLGRAEETFEYFARAWHDAQKARWKAMHTGDVIGRMERDIFPLIGAFPVTDVEERLLLAALNKVEQRGAIETARRLRQRAEWVFRFARAAGARNANPATDVKEAMAALPKKRRWPAITEIGCLRQIVRDVDVAGASPVTGLASRFLALTAQRPGMLLRLPWSEIERVDWDRPDLACPDAV